MLPRLRLLTIPYDAFYEAVELTEPRLVSVDSDAIFSSALVDRRRDEASAVSNCCLVCWCMILAHDQYSGCAAGTGGLLTVGMRTWRTLVAKGRIASRKSPVPQQALPKGLG